MRIGILSDSHHKTDLTKNAIEFLKQKDVEFLIHGGDLCLEENLVLLKSSGINYISVFGNNDKSLQGLATKYKIRMEPYHFKLQDLKIKLMHLPMYLNNDGADLVIYGHTHIFECDLKDKTLFINPGEICGRESGECQFVLLDVKQNKYLVQYYYKKIEDKEFKKQEFEYERK